VLLRLLGGGGQKAWPERMKKTFHPLMRRLLIE